MAGAHCGLVFLSKTETHSDEILIIIFRVNRSKKNKYFYQMNCFSEYPLFKINSLAQDSLERFSRSCPLRSLHSSSDTNKVYFVYALNYE